MKLKKYDIILVFLIYRRHNFYLNLVNELSQTYKIGIMDSGFNKVKTKETDDYMKQLLFEKGVEEVLESAECDLLVIPNYNYDQEFVNLLKKNVSFKKAIAPSRSTKPQLEWLQTLKDIGVTTILPESKKRFHYELNTEEMKSITDQHFDVISMGAPYKKYPAISIPEADYILAYPTQFGMTDNSQVFFLKNIVNLLKNIKNDKVYFKQHNARDYGNHLYNQERVDRIKKIPTFILNILQKCFDVLLKAFKSKESIIHKKLVLYSIDIMNTLIFKKTIPLWTVTPYANLGIEVFLPFIKKGLITGKSTCVWFALYNKLPVYNCDDFDDIGSDTVLDNVKFYGVKPCKGKLEFDPTCFDKIDAEDRNADFIQYIKDQLDSLKEKS